MAALSTAHTQAWHVLRDISREWHQENLHMSISANIHGLHLGTFHPVGYIHSKHRTLAICRG